MFNTISKKLPFEISAFFSLLMLVVLGIIFVRRDTASIVNSEIYKVYVIWNLETLLLSILAITFLKEKNIDDS